MVKMRFSLTAALLVMAAAALMFGFNGCKNHQANGMSYTFQGRLATQMARAIQRGQVSTLQKLIAEGGEINATNRQGTMTLLYWTVKCRRVKEFRMLLAADAKPVARVDGEPIMSAVTKQDKADKFLAALFDAGISPNEGVGTHKSPLDYAIGHDQFTGSDYADQMLQHGADVDHQDAAGFTPLFYAALSNYFDMVRKLIEAGADPSLVNKRGETFQSYLKLERPKSTYSKSSVLKKHDVLRNFLRERNIPVTF